MKMLSYPKMPRFICYHNKAFPFGIIQANAPTDITRWLCTKCINTVFNPNSPQNKFDLAISDVWGTGEGLITQQVFTIKKETNYKKSSPKMKNLQKSTPLLTNSIQMLCKDSEGDGESSTTKPSITLAKKL